MFRRLTGKWQSPGRQPSSATYHIRKCVGKVSPCDWSYPVAIQIGRAILALVLPKNMSDKKSLKMNEPTVKYEHLLIVVQMPTASFITK